MSLGPWTGTGTVRGIPAFSIMWWLPLMRANVQPAALSLSTTCFPFMGLTVYQKRYKYAPLHLPDFTPHSGQRRILAARKRRNVASHQPAVSP